MDGRGNPKKVSNGSSNFSFFAGPTTESGAINLVENDPQLENIQNAPLFTCSSNYNPTGELDHWTRFKQGVRNKKAGDLYWKSNLRRSKLFGMYIVSRSNIISDYSNVKVVFSVVIADILYNFS